MSDTVAAEGRVVTFYSYKGGTGRSMALANVSWLLALSGFRVLVIDWDLEAPGLHRYFRPFLEDDDLAESEGLIDFVIHFAEAASEQIEQTEADWYKPYSNLLPYAKELNYDFPGEGTLDFIPAGRQGSAYAARVNSFNWKHFYEKLNGGQVLEEARRILIEEYDYVLIDSRTGVSDTAGICTVQMPDDLVVGFTLNLQSVIGAAAATASVINQRAQRGKAIRVFPVPMRVEPNEKLKTDTMKAFAKPRFVALLPATMTDDERDKYWAESDVPYVPFYAFEENLAYFRDEPNSKNSVLSAMIRIASQLTSSEIIELPKLEPGLRTKTIAAYDAFSGTSTIKARTAVYLSVDSDSSAAGLRTEIENSGFDLLTRERFEKARSAVFLMAVGASGLTVPQIAELAVAQRARNGPIYTVLLPGAQPEALPRLLLPFGVIDLRSGGRFALPDPANGEQLEHLPVSPYPGLNPFTASDGPVFIARGALIERLVEAVKRSNFVGLIGPSHSGRTSLVQAGLIPRLKTLEPPNPAWDVRFALPAAANDQVRLLLVMDATALAVAAVTDLPESACVLAIAETAEQIAFCEKRLGRSAERVDVFPLSDAELTAAITEPAMRAGLPIEAGLAGRIVADLKNERAQLPLLQYVMSELYAGDPRGALTVEKYERLGGTRMVECKCEILFAGSGLSSLSRLVYVAENGSLAAHEAPEASMQPEDRVALDAFVSAGVLVRDGDSLRFASGIFLDRWPRLRQWVEQNRDFLVWRQQLDQSLARWQQNRQSFTLLGGDLLAEAPKWVMDRRGDLNERELAYIEASAKSEQTELQQRSATLKLEEKRRKRIQALIAASLLALVVVGVLTYRLTSNTAPTGSGVQDPGVAAIVRAYAQRQSGDYAAAIATLTDGLQASLNPKLKEQMYRDRAFAYKQQQPPDWVRSIADLSQGLSLARSSGIGKDIPILLMDRAGAYIQARDPELAIRDYAEVLRDVPGDAQVKNAVDSLSGIFNPGSPDIYLIDRPGLRADQLPLSVKQVYSKFGFIHLRAWANGIPDTEIRYTASQDAAYAQEVVDALRSRRIDVQGPIQMQPSEGRQRYLQLWLSAPKEQR